MPAFLTPGLPGTVAKILKGVSGYVTSGQVLAIMGASGSGKTTLMNCLIQNSGIYGQEITGLIKFNGTTMTPQLFKRDCYFVPQADLLTGSITCRECLNTAVQLYNPSYDGTKEEYIDEILNQFGLMPCADTKIGNVLIKGISGGQKRRLSIAVGVIKSPKMMFLDEPTSGLDSLSAVKIMDLLSELAHQNNMLIVCVIHQPSSQTYLKLDRVLVLTKGRVAYFGKAGKARAYLNRKDVHP
eukprot:UN29435